MAAREGPADVVDAHRLTPPCRAGLASFLAQKHGQLRPAREGSLLQRAARSVAQRLLEELPLQQARTCRSLLQACKIISC